MVGTIIEKAFSNFEFTTFVFNQGKTAIESLGKLLEGTFYCGHCLFKEVSCW